MIKRQVLLSQDVKAILAEGKKDAEPDPPALNT